MIRLSWTQPEDLVPHAFAAALADGREVADLIECWQRAGGSVTPPVSGATPQSAPPALRALGRRLLGDVAQRPVPEDLLAREPSDWESITTLIAARPLPVESQPVGSQPVGSQPVRSQPVERSASAVSARVSSGLQNRIHGAWLGRAAGCLLGKPVEKIDRAGIRAIAESTGNWPISGYFTERGLDPAVAAAYPWNRRSRPTSLAENIDGMPEDDDLNYALIALRLVEQNGRDFDTDAVAQAWLNDLPGGRLFTAERITYRNLLLGVEPDAAAEHENPFTDWIGALIRTDLYGWVSPGDPLRAARMAWTDARLSHTRNGIYGAMFVAAACSCAVLDDDLDRVIETGLSVVPPHSRLADAIRFGVELGRSPATRDLDRGLDSLHDRFDGLHWVHVLNNAALLGYALARSAGDFELAISTAVAGGWDTDSVGATAGSITGALTGASGLPRRWIAPLRNRLASSIPGMGILGFDELARRTSALIEKEQP